MMAYSHIIKPKITQDVLGLLNHVEFVWRNRLPVRNARAQTSHLGLIGRGKAELGGKFPNLSFGQAGFLEGSANLEFGSRLGTRTMISNIAGIFSISEHCEASLRCQRCEFGEEFVLAEVTAVVWIREVIGIFKLARANDAYRKLELLRQRQGLFKLAAGQAG